MNDETTTPVEGVKRLRQLEAALRLYAQHGGRLVSEDEALNLATDLDRLLSAWNRRAPTHGVGREDGSSVADIAASVASDGGLDA